MMTLQQQLAFRASTPEAGASAFDYQTLLKATSRQHWFIFSTSSEYTTWRSEEGSEVKINRHAFNFVFSGPGGAKFYNSLSGITKAYVKVLVAHRK